MHEAFHRQMSREQIWKRQDRDGAVHLHFLPLYHKMCIRDRDYVVNEQGKVKTSGTVTDADGVKYRITKQSDGTYKIEITD